MPVERPNPEVSRWIGVGSLADLLLFALIYGSVVAAFLFESSSAALVALAAFSATLMVHVATGVIVYRQIMGRPWPHVEPLVDDDDWDAA